MRYTEGSAAISGLGTISLALGLDAEEYETLGVRTYCVPVASSATLAGATLEGAV